MANTNFSTSNEILRKLLGNGLTYKIPSFQRDYSWTADEWEDLWEDILELIRGEDDPAHYMGYLVLQSTDSKQHDVIDGQQRLTTMSLIILAAIANLVNLSEDNDPQLTELAEQNKRRAEQLRSSYIGYLDPVTLISKSKLELNRHNNDYYQTYLVPLDELPKRGIRASEHSLRKAYEFYYKRIKEHSTYNLPKNLSNGETASQRGINIAQLVDKIVDSFFFTVITVTDELNAFKVFETLNARGVRLSSTDLLKNYLFSIVNSTSANNHDLDIMEGHWERIVGTLGSEKLPEFLRTYWNSKNKLVRKADLFKTIRKELQTKEQAFKLIRELDKAAHIYVALRTPSDSLWSREEKKYLEELRMFSVRQQLPFLMAAQRKFYDSDRKIFESILRAVSIISFRYNVICNLHTNELERVYNQVALKLENQGINTKGAIYTALAALYPDDKLFKANFQEKELITANSRNKKIVRYILFKLEEQMGGIRSDFESAKISIEHICPENPEEEDWSEETARYVYRLGNMVMLETGLNRNIENKSYAEKKATLASSAHLSANYIAEHYDVWNLDKINAHQNAQAKLALTIWSLQIPS